MTSFPIYPDPGTSDYVTVKVFGTVAAMKRYAENLWSGLPGARGSVEDIRAMCVFYSDDPRGARFGEVLFHKGSLKAELIAHEMLHCAIRFDNITKDPRGSYQKTLERREEQLCTYIGTLVRQVHEQIQKRGIHLT